MGRVFGSFESNCGHLAKAAGATFRKSSKNGSLAPIRSLRRRAVARQVVDGKRGRLRRHGTGPASAPHELSDTWVLERCISLGGEGQGGEGGLPATSWRLKAKLVEPSGPLEGLPAAAAGTATQGQGAAETVAVGNATATSTATSTAMPARRHTTERAS